MTRTISSKQRAAKTVSSATKEVRIRSPWQKSGKPVLEGSRWFRRFYNDCKAISKDIQFKRIKLGFYRLYFRGAYLYEVYKEMPERGYDIDDLDPRFESQKYFEEYEDNAELTRNIKNFVEGYWEALDRIRTRVYMFKNNEEFYKEAVDAYKEMIVK